MPQFGGAAEKCAVCNKTVYLTEKIVVEDKEDKKTFHKGCLQCSHCKCNLTLGNYASMQGVFYCKPHFKQLFATKGNYDEGFGKDKHSKNWTPTAAAAPASFVPVDRDEGSSKEKKETPTSIASKFQKTSLNTEKCYVCDKTVYATEKTVIEEKEGKKVFHKTCLKCSHCGVIVTLGNYASMQGVVYCKPHFKQLFAQKGNYDEGFGKEKAAAKWEPHVNTAPTTFVPVEKDDVSKEKRAAPEGVASRFKGTASNTEKCAACSKTVYATERIVVEDRDDKQTYHKTCLKCSHCNVVLTLGNYASMQGVLYCKPHFKQLFAAKGNYDEGFGKEKHTKKWADKDGEESSTPREKDAHELEREIEREKEQQIERDIEKKKAEKEKSHTEDKEKEELERRRAEEKAREEREEREREEREEREREAEEAAERKRLEENLEKEQEHAHEHHHHDHDHDHEHSHDHDHDHDHEHSHSHDHEHDHEHEHKHDDEEHEHRHEETDE